MMENASIRSWVESPRLRCATSVHTSPIPAPVNVLPPVETCRTNKRHEAIICLPSTRATRIHDELWRSGSVMKCLEKYDLSGGLFLYAKTEAQNSAHASISFDFSPRMTYDIPSTWYSRSLSIGLLSLLILWGMATLWCKGTKKMKSSVTNDLFSPRYKRVIKCDKKLLVEKK